MKIKSKREVTVPYSVIQPGEVFQYGLRYAMKIRPLMDEDGTEVDAIDLEDGSHLYISVCEKVTRAEVELVVL